MGWPEALVASIVSINTVLLAWLTTRQQQVKRALNGHSDDVTKELQTMHAEIRRVFQPPDDAINRRY